LGRQERVRHHGVGIMGLGLIFLGMTVMGDAMGPLRTYQPFLDAMVRMASPAVGILAGALFTALIQSSSATSGIVIVIASQGLVTLPAGIASTTSPSGWLGQRCRRSTGRNQLSPDDSPAIYCGPARIRWGVL
jgi:Na+/phosphate symporter